MTKMVPNRRQAMMGLLAVATAGMAVGCKEKEDHYSPQKRSDAEPDSGGFLSVSEFALLSALAQTIIPKTDTAGAMEAGVPDTLQELLTGWGDDDVRTYWRAGLTNLDDHFKTAKGGGVFAELGAKKQLSLLDSYDKAVYKNDIKDGFYKDMKQTIATAYYMSEPGATEELAYDPVPGEFKGCIPFSDVGKAWAT